MMSLCLGRIPLGECEDVLARIWLALEAYGVASPKIVVDTVSLQLVDVHLAFRHAADAEIALDAIRRSLDARVTVTLDKHVPRPAGWALSLPFA